MFDRSVYAVYFVSFLALGCATTTSTTGTAAAQNPASQTSTPPEHSLAPESTKASSTTQPAAPTQVGDARASNTSDLDAAMLANKTWQQRMNIEFELFKSRDHVAFEQVLNLAPDEKTRSGRLVYTDKRLRDPRAAPVLLHRMLSGSEKPAVRRALADALPMTKGDWEEAVSHMLKVEADPQVRLALVRCMRHSKSPYDLQGLRAGLRDENPDVQVAALETAGYVANGKVLVSELLSATFDDKWERRAAAIRSLGNLRENRAWKTLLRGLSDPKPEVRLQALISLEKIDAGQAAQLPEVRKLASDGSMRVAKQAKALLKHSQQPAGLSVEPQAPEANDTATPEPGPGPESLPPPNESPGPKPPNESVL